MKTQVIHRHNAAILGGTTITAPVGAIIVSAVPRLSQPGWNIYLMHGTDEGAPTRTYHFASIKTGVPFPEGAKHLAAIAGLGMHLISMTAAQVTEWKELYPEINEADADS